MSSSPMKKVGLVVGSFFAILGVFFAVFIVIEMFSSEETPAVEDAVPGMAEEEVQQETEVQQEAEVQEAAEDGWQEFSQDDLGYSISYPGHWVFEDQGNVIMFSGAEGSEEFYTTVNMQNMFSVGISDGRGNLQAVGASIEKR